MSEIKSCYMCDNARINEELTDNTDFSSSCLGHSADGYRIMFSSGNGKPPRIEIEQYDSYSGWYRVALYYPKFCPNCGREIKEYDSTGSN